MGEARDTGLAEDCCAQGRPVNPSSHALSWEAVQALNAFLVWHRAGLGFIKFRFINKKLGPLRFAKMRHTRAAACLLQKFVKELPANRHHQ